MSIDTYGLSTEQYEEFFDDNLDFAAKLYSKVCARLSFELNGNVDYKTILNIYQEAVYSTNDDCRRYQKANNPEALKETTADLFSISPSREELLEEIKVVSAKVEALADYVSNLVTITTSGLEGIATTLDKPVD